MTKKEGTLATTTIALANMHPGARVTVFIADNEHHAPGDAKAVFSGFAISSVLTSPRRATNGYLVVAAPDGKSLHIALVDVVAVTVLDTETPRVDIDITLRCDATNPLWNPFLEDQAMPRCPHCEQAHTDWLGPQDSGNIPKGMGRCLRCGLLSKDATR